MKVEGVSGGHTMQYTGYVLYKCTLKPIWSYCQCHSYKLISLKDFIYFFL